MTNRKALINKTYEEYKVSDGYTSLEKNTDFDSQDKLHCLISEIYERVQKHNVLDDLMELTSGEKVATKLTRQVIDLNIDKNRKELFLYEMINSEMTKDEMMDRCLDEFYGNTPNEDIELFKDIEKCLLANNDPLLLKRKYDSKKSLKENNPMCLDGGENNLAMGKLNLVQSSYPVKEFVSGSVWFLKIVDQMLIEQNQLVATLELVNDKLQNISPSYNPDQARKELNQLSSMLELLIHARSIAINSDEDACMTYENNHLQKAKDQFGYDDPFENKQ